MTNLKLALADEDFKHVWGAYPRERAAEALAHTSLDLVCGRRDRASFQVMLQAAEAFTLAVTDNPAFSWQGDIPGLRLAVRWTDDGPALQSEMNLIGLVEDDDRLWRADTLLADEAAEVAAGFVQPVWVEIAIPADAAPGLRRGRVEVWEHRLFSAEELVGALEFSVEIKAVTLPEPRAYRLWLDLWQHLSNLARKHEVKLWSDEHFAVLEPYTAALAALGQKAITCVVSEIPWSGQGCCQVTNYPSNYYEYSLVSVARDAAGAWRYDFSVLDRYIELCFAHGIDGEIEVLGLCNIWRFEEYGFGGVAADCPEALRVRYRDETTGSYRYMDTCADLTAYVQSLEAHFAARGWLERVRVTADEPADPERYAAVLDWLGEIAPGLRLKSAFNHAAFLVEFADRVEDFVPLLNCLVEEYEVVRRRLESGRGRLSYYVCCAPDYPNNWLASPLVESRLLMWLVLWSGVHGFLRWDFTAWPERPREQAWWRWKTGDTHFVLPGNNGRPLLTLRYKALQRGIQDYELARQLQDRHPQAEAILTEIRTQLLRLPDWRDLYATGQPPADLYSQSHEDYDKARRRLLEELAALPG
ncbi:MAG TPA: DUF4091 domain-containing protein [Armatimonadota bacterium]